ncbi:hypothetical protein [Actinomadura coerulea]|uniref:hypothetical protein n=1 Tax=Actinomadura coerulea TaxID=46159 RepID=UPI003428F9F5
MRPTFPGRLPPGARSVTPWERTSGHPEGTVFRRLSRAFAVIEGFAVLNVIPVEPARRALTVGCRYSRHGAWWLYYVHSGELIGPANDLAGAARQIRSQMEVAAAA